MSDPRLAHKHDRVDEGGATFLAQHSCTFAQRRTRCHHVIDHRAPRSIRVGKPKANAPLTARQRSCSARCPHRGTRPDLHKERRDQIVHPDTRPQGGDGVQVDRGQGVDGTAPQPRPMKRHWKDHAYVAMAGSRSKRPASRRPNSVIDLRDRSGHNRSILAIQRCEHVEQARQNPHSQQTDRSVMRRSRCSGPSKSNYRARSSERFGQGRRERETRPVKSILFQRDARRRRRFQRNLTVRNFNRRPE